MAGRVLLTGAGGLIGRQCIAPLLARGFEVVVLSRGTGTIQGATVVEADLLDHEAASRAIADARADHLLHLAWHSGAKDRWTSPLNLDWTAATFNLVKAFAAHGGRRAVSVGSCAEYDWVNETLDETTPLRPATLYGAAKAAAGLALTKAAPVLGISFAWARVFFCYGPGEPAGRLLGDLIRGLKAGKPVPCTDGLQERDFLYTEDVAGALAALLQCSVEGPVNIGSGKAVPVRDLIGEVARQMGRPSLIRLGAISRPPGDPTRLRANATRLFDEVGFGPRFSLEDGVAATLEAEGAA